MAMFSLQKVSLSVAARFNLSNSLTHPHPDNPVAQKLLAKQLERFDLNVVATSNGEEAIAG